MDLPPLAYLASVLSLLWVLSLFNVSSLWLFLLAFFFMFQVDKNYMRKLQREIRNKERRSAFQARPLSDYEPADWINQALEKIWPFLEDLISNEILSPIVPWFIEKHKPWTVRQATLQHLKLGQEPPKIRGVRTLQHNSGDDDLVMDFFLDFAAAEDMIAILGVQVRRRLGFGIKTNIHISKLQIEGKVRIGIKFSKSFPFITRFRLCFETAPYVQMNARPLSAHGLNVSELPLIAGWMERLIADVFEQSLVEPNMLVVDVEKLLNSKGALQDSLASVLDECLHVKGKAAVAVVKLDILEATDLKPSDLNGLADPYVVGSFASYSFKTKVHKKTLKPKWYEKVEIPIYSWEVTSLLILHVRDKDQFIDDELGFCELDLSLYRDGQEHDLWINLSDVKMGRLHLNFVITEVVSSSESSNHQVKGNNDDTKEQKVELLEERFEIIDLGKGENEGGFLSVVSPGQQMRTKSWQQRHRISKKETSTNQKEVLETVCQETSRSTSSSDSAKIETENKFSTQEHPNEPSLSSVLEVKPLSRNDCNHQVTGNKATVKLNLETSNIDVAKSIGEPPSPIYLKGHDESELDSPSEHNVRRKAKGLLKQAEKAAQHIKSSFNRRASRKRYEDENIKDSSAPGTPY